jgi:predicted Zn finger-like uncharacterized protein
VKFLCDRCKTRYSIGDDRVRGKILKIRCKNCANVITVREGMDAGDDSRGRPTTAAPPIAETKPANGALNAAFSAQLAKPPPALEEEWYVSIDGDQSGPFSLTEAQRWVASKSLDADLHCWSEGFDDWLPVDKVSHFRGLRKKAAPSTPPPMPRPAPRAPAAPAARVPLDEDTPKPLFAATMASLEKSASTTLPPVNASATPGAKTNGAPAIPAAAMRAPTAAKAPAIPSVKPALPQVGKPTVPALGGKAVPAPTTGKGTGPVRSAGAQALAAAFDTSDPADSMTSVDSPAFDDEIATTAEPLASAKKGVFDRLEPLAEPPKPEAPKKLGLDALAAEHKGGDLVDDDNLDIGEVSRVVNLKDLARPPAATSKKTGAVGRITGPVNRVTASVARLAPEEVGLPATPTAPQPELGAGESIVAPTQVAKDHRRGLIMLIGVAAVLLVGVIGAVVLMVASGDDDGPMGLGRTTMLNTDRPEDQINRTKPGEPQGSAAGPAKQQHITTNHWIPTNPGNQHVQEEPTDPNLKRLGADEIEDMAAKNGEGTKFCYIRAQKGALGLEMLDLKKIEVTLTIDKTGTVTDVQLSDHAKDTFGSCLIARIKGWHFRVSPGGTYRFALAFSNG